MLISDSLGKSFVVTKNTKKPVSDLVVGDYILCGDNNYHPILSVNVKTTSVLSVKGFWFNAFKMPYDGKLYVRQREDCLKNMAEWICVSEFVKNENWQNYYICTFGHFFDGVIDDAIYDGNYAWIPFRVVDENKQTTVYEITVDEADSIVVNLCIVKI